MLNSFFVMLIRCYKCILYVGKMSVCKKSVKMLKMVSDKEEKSIYSGQKISDISFNRIPTSGTK